MITSRSLHLRTDSDRFILPLSKPPSDPERPFRRSFSFSSSILRAGLESTLLIRPSRSASCFSVSSRRLDIDIYSAVPTSSVSNDTVGVVETSSPVVQNDTKVDVAGQDVGSTEAPACSASPKQYSSMWGSPSLVYTQPSRQIGSGFTPSSAFSWYSPFKVLKLPSASWSQVTVTVQYLPT